MKSFVYASNSKKIWSDFKEKFDKLNLTSILLAEKYWCIDSTNRDSDFLLVKDEKILWDQMDVMVHFSSCDSKETNSNGENVKRQRLLQFLVGLNESYAQVRSSILLGPFG